MAQTQQVDVVGRGPSVAVARQDAVRQAVVKIMAQQSTTERIGQVDPSSDDVLMATMMGFVDRFEVLETIKGDEEVRLRARVTINEADLRAMQQPAKARGESLDGTSLVARAEADLLRAQARSRMINRTLEQLYQSVEFRVGAIEPTRDRAGFAVTVQYRLPESAVTFAQQALARLAEREVRACRPWNANSGWMGLCTAPTTTGRAISLLGRARQVADPLDQSQRYPRVDAFMLDATRTRRGTDGESRNPTANSIYISMRTDETLRTLLEKFDFTPTANDRTYVFGTPFEVLPAKDGILLLQLKGDEDKAVEIPLVWGGCSLYSLGTIPPCSPQDVIPPVGINFETGQVMIATQTFTSTFTIPREEMAGVKTIIASTQW